MHTYWGAVLAAYDGHGMRSSVRPGRLLWMYLCPTCKLRLMTWDTLVKGLQTTVNSDISHCWHGSWHRRHGMVWYKFAWCTYPRASAVKGEEHQKNPVGICTEQIFKGQFSSNEELQFLFYLSDSKHSNVVITIWKFSIIWPRIL